jgi:hypothetical protein
MITGYARTSMADQNADLAAQERSYGRNWVMAV